MYYKLIGLTFLQMMNIGVHLGHTLKTSKFLSYWMFSSWRDKIFIIDLVKTFYILRLAIKTTFYNSWNFEPFWFINLDKYFGSYIYRYAVLCGETFSIYDWIPGTLTNYNSIISWYNTLVRLLNQNKYGLRYRDEKKVGQITGFLNTRGVIPGLIFLSNILQTGKVLDEINSLKIPCMGIIDSNILSWGITLPIPGNDDSIMCLNFYCYIFTRAVLQGKIKNSIDFIFARNEMVERKHKKVKIKNKMIALYLYKNDTIFDQKILKRILNIDGDIDDNIKEGFVWKSNTYEQLFAVSFKRNILLSLSDKDFWKKWKPKVSNDSDKNFLRKYSIITDEAYRLF
jgi:small subunit ribosomal protein S2